jgi:anti-sigma regulatory factor (Ser/Thr protein kinase)
MMAKSINQALRHLREVTMPLAQVAHNACALAGLDPHSPMYRPLSLSYFKVIAAVDDAGERLHQSGKELAYHNRAHAADAITALACLLADTSDLSDTDKWLAMIAMAGHDFGHQGKTNQQLGCSQEEITATWLQAEVAECISTEQLSRLTDWVIGTDPALVAANHAAYAASPKDVDVLLQVLINEADIAASLLPEFALGLTRQLLLERGLSYQNESEVQAFYEGFLVHARVSSPAGKRLLMAEPKHVDWYGAGQTLFHGSYDVSPAAVGVARAEVMQALARLAVHEPSRLDVEIALGEVLQNIVRYADFSQKPMRKFDIEAIQNHQNLSLRVTDSAQPLIDLGFLNHQHAASEKGGMGLTLIHKITSKYSISALKEGNLHELFFEGLIELD